MIFATVGSQTPFDRLVRALDAWCARGQAQVLAQIGAGGYEPRHMRWLRMCTPAEFRDHCRAAELIVAHAGMGSVLTALEFGKPLLLVPRRGDLGETRNDHQLATARWLRGRPGIEVADGEDTLAAALDAWLPGRDSRGQAPIAPSAQPRLLEALRRFVGEP